MCQDIYVVLLNFWSIEIRTIKHIINACTLINFDALQIDISAWRCTYILCKSEGLN